MTYWPYDKYVLTSRLSSEQLKRKFDSVPNFSNDPNTKETILGNNAFRFACRLYRNHLEVREYDVGRKITPEAEIFFDDTAQGTICIIVFRLRLKNKLFLLFAAIFLLIAEIAMILGNTHRSDSSAAPFIPLMMLLAVYYVAVAGFSSNKPQLESFLSSLLELNVPT